MVMAHIIREILIGTEAEKTHLTSYHSGPMVALQDIGPALM